MPTKRVSRDVAKLPSIPKELVNLFLTGPMTGEAINDAGAAFKKALIEASLNAELSHHLGYQPGAERPDAATNQRNGSTAKTILTDEGKLRIDTPRDRDGSFEPLLVPKHARRFTGFDDKIIALYARGLTMREMQGYLGEMYGIEVSPELISTVTDAVLGEVTAWQNRPLEPVYPVVFFDALRVKIREDGVVRNKAVYLALGCVGTARGRSSGSGSRTPRERSSG
jgi:putative transposase